MAGRTTPLYVVCSPCRCVGKTLIARLLTEFHILEDREVAAFDLADEGPQLADYLPKCTTLVDISNIRGQMNFFEQLISENAGAKIIDLSHRMFMKFFTIVSEIDFFEEARRRSIEPLILFVVAPDPKSSETYATLWHRFKAASLLPVRNQCQTAFISTLDAPPTTSPTSLEIPLLGFSLRALIDRQSFLFSNFWQATPAALPGTSDDELRDWVEFIFLQFRDLEISLGCEEYNSGVMIRTARRPGATDRKRQPNVVLLTDHVREDPAPAGIGQGSLDVPEEILKFVPKKQRGSVQLDRSGNSTLLELRKAGLQLRSTEDRITQLEAEIRRFRDRAARADQWFQLIQRELNAKLIEPMLAQRSKINDLDS